MPATIEQLKREALAGLASLDASLVNMPPLEPDVEAMITAPAKTVAGSITLLDAIKPLMKHTCRPDDGSNEGPWFEAPAESIDGPRARRYAVSDEAARVAVEGVAA